jgi:hypothetical protein
MIAFQITRIRGSNSENMKDALPFPSLSLPNDCNGLKLRGHCLSFEGQCRLNDYENIPQSTYQTPIFLSSNKSRAKNSAIGEVKREKAGARGKSGRKRNKKLEKGIFAVNFGCSGGGIRGGRYESHDNL